MRANCSTTLAACVRPRNFGADAAQTEGFRVTTGVVAALVAGLVPFWIAYIPRKAKADQWIADARAIEDEKRMSTPQSTLEPRTDAKAEP